MSSFEAKPIALPEVERTGMAVLASQIGEREAAHFQESTTAALSSVRQAINDNLRTDMRGHSVRDT